MTDPVAKAEMLIRRPVAEVFEAFVDPAVTSRFWFTDGSARLEVGRRVRWDWTMYGVSADVEVKAVEENRRILIEWPGEGGRSEVEWLFTPRGEEATFVSIRNSGFTGDPGKKIEAAIQSTEGFALVLAGLKAWLEQGVTLGLVADRHPDALVQPA